MTKDIVDKLISEAGAVPPVDYSKRVLTDGSPVTDDHTEIQPDGLQKGYVVLSEDERQRGFVRPVRNEYRHLTCGTTTWINKAIAETYARCPTFYSGTYCCRCKGHFPVGPHGEFVWISDNTMVGE